MTRGTLQCVFKHEPFDELRRLGVSSLVEENTRTTHPDSTGMLVVEQVTPKGPADKLMEPGDILTHINGKQVIDFVRLEDILDSSVGANVKLSLERGGRHVDIDVTVGDLHQITPNRFVTLSAAILHDMSYQMAYTTTVPVVSPKMLLACVVTLSIPWVIVGRLCRIRWLYACDGRYPAKLGHHHGQQRGHA